MHGKHAAGTKRSWTGRCFLILCCQTQPITPQLTSLTVNTFYFNMVCLLSSRETCSQIVSISPIRMTQAECRSGSGAVLVGGCFNKIGASTIQWQSSCARDGKFVVANGACPERYGRLVASAGAEGRTMVSDNVGKSCEEGTTTTGCEEGTGHRVRGRHRA